MIRMIRTIILLVAGPIWAGPGPGPLRFGAETSKNRHPGKYDLRFCQIWSDFVRFGQILLDFVRFYQILSDLAHMGPGPISESICDSPGLGQ